MKAKASGSQTKEEQKIKDLKEFEEKVIQKNKVIAHQLDYQQYQMGVERWYFFLHDFLKEQLDYEVLKTEDEFLSAEMSSFWGVQAQRLGMQQDKAMQMLGTIGGMVKSLFQILRSLRIIDERLEYYEESKKGKKAAEIALKGIWVDLVEGGAKNPSSIYGMASQVGFVTLPDLFFDVTPKSAKSVDSTVDKLDVNNKVKEVLKRKLFQFMEWKEATYNELKTSKKFHLKYLKQHVNSIKIYVRWLKPYLKTIERLQKKSPWADTEIVSALETAVIDLELFSVNWQKYDKDRKIRGKKVKKGDKKKYHPCIRVKFHYRTAPQMMYQQEYQRGAIHVGKTEMNFEAIVLSEKQIEKYKELKDKEDIELLTAIDESMEALKDDLEKYLAEADVEDAKDEKKSDALISTLSVVFEKFKKPFEPFINIGKGAKQLAGAFVPGKSKKTSEKDTWLDKRDKEKLKGSVKEHLWIMYESFKKAFKMTTW